MNKQMKDIKMKNMTNEIQQEVKRIREDIKGPWTKEIEDALTKRMELFFAYTRGQDTSYEIGSGHMENGMLLSGEESADAPWQKRCVEPKHLQINEENGFSRCIDEDDSASIMSGWEMVHYVEDEFGHTIIKRY